MKRRLHDWEELVDRLLDRDRGLTMDELRPLLGLHRHEKPWYKDAKIGSMFAARVYAGPSQVVFYSVPLADRDLSPLLARMRERSAPRAAIEHLQARITEHVLARRQTVSIADIVMEVSKGLNQSRKANTLVVSLDVYQQFTGKILRK